ncbi:argininosuccinate lyase [Pendulispora rubella]|uniref:Argininosuccinate lyase n=1 Tax=Pendulispora rubella TaxID=2741070 RepID=A0ABZ2LGB5_9BACT
MENTGRITRTIRRTARDILFGATADAAIDAELPFIAQVDRAHVVMLAESALIDRNTAASLLAAIDELRQRRFEPLRGRAALRGVYLLYEDYLIGKTGMSVGGMLQLGRSRNDLNATAQKLRLRAPWLRLVRESLRLQAILLRRSHRYAGVVMPAYTHFQAAVPITYGHYLAGIGSSLDRDLDALLATGSLFDVSPLGAGAVGGTALPIRAERTAELLGFVRPTPHSIDAVASRDGVLRVLAAASILGVTLSRVATDFLLWSTSEFDFLSFPDHLVGSSSMMPQKRNVYFLEHVQGRAASALGAFTHAVQACHAKPFTNSIAVGTEAVSAAWDALRKTTEAVILLRLIAAEAEPRRSSMEARARDGHTSATELANRLVGQGGVPFRTAHHTVGSFVRAALENDQPLEDVARHGLREAGSNVSTEGLDAASVATASQYGGGPGSTKLAVKELTSHWSAHCARLRVRTQSWRAADDALDRAAAHIFSNA